jgi:hypothetical protein
VPLCFYLFSASGESVSFRKLLLSGISLLVDAFDRRGNASRVAAVHRASSNTSPRARTENADDSSTHRLEVAIKLPRLQSGVPLFFAFGAHTVGIPASTISSYPGLFIAARGVEIAILGGSAQTVEKQK